MARRLTYEQAGQVFFLEPLVEYLVQNPPQHPIVFIYFQLAQLFSRLPEWDETPPLSTSARWAPKAIHLIAELRGEAWDHVEKRRRLYEAIRALQPIAAGGWLLEKVDMPPLDDG